VHVGGRGAVKVTGTITLPQEHATETCHLELLRADESEPPRKREIATAFDEVFFISPSRHRYYLLVSCEGVATTYKTEEIELEGMKRYNEPVALGEVPLDQ
jgi:hypothetical protein